MIRPRDVPVATMTLVRDEREETEMLATIETLARGGRRVFVTDGGSRPSFVQALLRLPVKVVAPSARGLVRQVAASLRAAASAGAPFILYTEPDKREFFERALEPFLAQAVDVDRAGVVLAARSRASFDTFPPFQRYTEDVFNQLCAEMIGEPGDYCYGPFLMNAACVSEVDALPDTLGWGWRPYVFSRAKRLGHRVVAIADEYPCPRDQYVSDRSEHVHRLQQLQQNIEGLVLALNRT